MKFDPLSLYQVHLFNNLFAWLLNNSNYVCVYVFLLMWTDENDGQTVWIEIIIDEHENDVQIKIGIE